MITGRVTIINSSADYYRIKRPTIVVAVKTHPDIVLAIKYVQAIVTELNNKLCHAAIIAREYDIPIVMGVEGVTKEFKTGDKVTVDIKRKMIWKT
jgi:pyruvate,water dikinase